MVQKREIVTCILLYIITCGIYGIVWFINLTDDIAEASGDTEFSGVKAFLFSLITCGIYRFYWAYKMGKNLQIAQKKKKMQTTDNSPLFVILEIFKLHIITYCLLQSELNDLSEVSQ